MDNHKTQFIINLTKVPSGFLFHSLHQPQIVQSKKKIASNNKSKKSTSRNLNHRIARELALDLQPPSEALQPIPEEEDPKKLFIIEPEEEISVEIKRETGLPDSPVTWFDQTKVHPLETQCVPDFFGGKPQKTPQLYMKYRNFMIQAYRLNPHQYLTKVACRRVLKGDVTSLMKVHSFLEKVGLINFGISKDGNYSFVSSIFSKAINSTPKISNIDKIPDTDEQKTYEPVDSVSLTHSYVNKCFSKSNRLFCLKCDSICGIIWYQKKIVQENDEGVICLNCYENLPVEDAEGYVKSDLLKKQDGGPKQSQPSNWSIQDNMQLLEYISQSHDSWNQLQNEKFGNKKKFDEIMIQFMQFPITNFELTDNPKQNRVEDKHQPYIERLLNRFKDSKKESDKQERKNKMSSDEQEKDGEKCANKEEFCSGMKNMIRKMQKKYEVKMNFLNKEEDLLAKSLFDLKFLATPIRKIQNFVLKSEQKLVNIDISEQNSEQNESEISKQQQNGYQEEQERLSQEQSNFAQFDLNDN